MVLGFHSQEMVGFSNTSRLSACSQFIFDGNLGVRFFFVISGFLITYLLIREQERNDTVSLKSFYTRRALRILPVYTVYLVVVAALQLTTQLHQALVTWIGDLTFTTNFLRRGIISAHLWSLSVEEQFYLIWIVHPLFHFQSSFVNFDSLDVGCMTAFLLARYGDKVADFLSGNRRLAAITFGLVLITIPKLQLAFLSPVWAITGNLLQAIGFAILLLTSILHPGCFKPLTWPIFVQLGVVSYSIYIWQEIFYAGPKTYGFSSAWWMSVPWWLLPAVSLGFVSYYGLERPLLKLRTRFRV